MRRSKKPTRESLATLRASNSVTDIAVKYGVAKITVEKWLQSFGLRAHVVRYGELTDGFSEFQSSVLVGNLLGDGCLTKGEANRNWLFDYGQRSDREEYVRFIRNTLRPFSKEVRFVKAKKPRSNDHCYSYRFRTLAHPLFSDLRKKWYIGNTKIVPQDIRLDWTSVAVWACDDGSNCQKNKCFRFATDCFSHGDVWLLRDALEKQLGLIASVVKKKDKRIISVTGESYIFLLNTLRPLIPWQCFAYKLRAGGSDGA